MKQLLTLLILAGTLSVSAQKADLITLKPLPKDSVTTTVKLTDSTLILSVQMVGRYAEGLKDQLTARQYEAFLFGINKILQEAIAEWNRKHQPKQK